MYYKVFIDPSCNFFSIQRTQRILRGIVRTVGKRPRIYVRAIRRCPFRHVKFLQIYSTKNVNRGRVIFFKLREKQATREFARTLWSVPCHAGNNMIPVKTFREHTCTAKHRFVRNVRDISRIYHCVCILRCGVRDTGAVFVPCVNALINMFASVEFL